MRSVCHFHKESAYERKSAGGARLRQTVTGAGLEVGVSWNPVNFQPRPNPFGFLPGQAWFPIRSTKRHPA